MAKTRKRCVCGASKFEGPFKQGEIVNGKMATEATVYRCLGCNKIGQLSDENFVRDENMPSIEEIQENA